MHRGGGGGMHVHPVHPPWVRPWPPSTCLLTLWLATSPYYHLLRCYHRWALKRWNHRNHRFFLKRWFFLDKQATGSLRKIRTDKSNGSNTFRVIDAHLCLLPHVCPHSSHEGLFIRSILTECIKGYKRRAIFNSFPNKILGENLGFISRERSVTVSSSLKP